MKTVMRVDNQITVILKHDNDIKITRETRKDHREWFDRDGNLIKDRQYIVIRFPKTKKHLWDKWEANAYEKQDIGYTMNDLGEEIEILFYDRITFTWRLRTITDTGLLKCQQRIIPNWKEHGELFPCYVNPSGFLEYSYDIIFGLLQMPFVLYKDYKRNKRRVC